MTANNRGPIRYRLNKVGNVIRDDRTFTPAFLDPIGNGYRKGDAIVAPKTSSPARLKYQAANNRRKRNLAALKAVEAATLL